MKRNPSLLLAEQALMLLVLALAAALCLQGFVWAGQTAAQNAARDGAVLAAQNAAEQLKLTQGAPLHLFYNKDWQPVDDQGAFLLTTRADGPGRAIVTVTDQQGTVLFTLPAAWQEVRP